MICPQTTVGCYNEPQCKSADSCVIHLCKPPKPTMAEIERFVDAKEEADFHLGYQECQDPFSGAVTRKREEANAARTALMAAIRAYGEGK